MKITVCAYRESELEAMLERLENELYSFTSIPIWWDIISHKFYVTVDIEGKYPSLEALQSFPK